MTRRVTILVAVILSLLSELVASSPFVRFSAGPAPILRKLVLWNASASVPRGLYLLLSPYPLRSNELVVATPPPPLAKFLDARGYLPTGVPLLKHVAALPGQTVCRVAHTITINGHVIAFARDDDRHRRLLPTWKGCRTLRPGEVFLLNISVPDSFDGRYFGPLPAAAITARADPLWTIGKD